MGKWLDGNMNVRSVGERWYIGMKEGIIILGGVRNDED